MNAKSPKCVDRNPRGIYLVWIAGLAGMAVVSASRPAAAKFDHRTAPAQDASERRIERMKTGDEPGPFMVANHTLPGQGDRHDP